MSQPEQKRRAQAASDTTLHQQEGGGPRVCQQTLERRTVLRGFGAAVALPMLEAMVPGGEATRPAARRRLVYVYVPNGVKVDAWRQPLKEESAPSGERGKRRRSGPELRVGEHAGLELPGLLKPLERFRKETLILRGLTADKARANGDGAGDHARAAAAFLTGVQPLKTEGRVRLGVSADRLAARRIGGVTRIRGLSLGLEPGLQSGQCDSGYACAYSGHVSWESEEIPAHKDVQAAVLFDRLFRGGDAAESRTARETRRARRRSVLDFVRGESKRLQGRLGAADRARLDEYETGLRELERQLAFPSSAHEDSVGDDQRPGGPSGRAARSFAEEARQMGEVLSLAFEADLTRIATFMYGNEGSGRRYTEVDVSEGHHSLSHHGGDEEKLAAIGRINRLHVGALTGFLESLASKRDLDGHLLDHSIVAYGSGIAEGNRHDHHDLPLVLVGGRQSGVRGGRTLVVPRETPLNNLHAALLTRMGVPGSVLFGDATGVLAL